MSQDRKVSVKPVFGLRPFGLWALLFGVLVQREPVPSARPKPKGRRPKPNSILLFVATEVSTLP